MRTRRRKTASGFRTSRSPGISAGSSRKRVLVVADSCYSGLLSTDPSYLFLNDKVSYSKEYIKFKLPKRSRLLLSSGGDQPVLDEGGGGNSVFARAFLDELEANQGILSSPELFSRIRKRVEVAAAKNKFVQTPEFKSIKGAGHEVGDFFFVPRAKTGCRSVALYVNRASTATSALLSRDHRAASLRSCFAARRCARRRIRAPASSAFRSMAPLDRSTRLPTSRRSRSATRR